MELNAQTEALQNVVGFLKFTSDSIPLLRDGARTLQHLQCRLQGKLEATQISQTAACQFQRRAVID